MAFEWLSGRSQESPLAEIIKELGEPVISRDLGQTRRPGTTLLEWCLLLLTETTFVILHSKPRNWAAQLFGTGAGKDVVRKISIESIGSVAIPVRRSWIKRIVRGPTVEVLVELLDGSPPIEIIADDRSLQFYEDVKRKVADR